MAYDIGPKIGIDGEAEFRSQISNITTQLKTLGSEMQVVTSEFGKNQGSEEALTAKNKVLQKEIDVQKTKLEQLNIGLQKSKDLYGENDTKTLKWQQTVNKATTDLNKMQNELKDNDSQLENMKNGVEDVGNSMDNAKEKSLTFSDVLKANLLSEAIIGGVKAIASSIKDLASGAMESADSIQQMSDQTGMSAESIQEWQYAGDTLGTSIDTITGSMSKMINNMSSASAGSGTAYDAFKKLGVSVTDSSGQLRDSNTVYSEVLGALGNIKNETERTATAQDIFGRSAADLNPLISAGTDGLNKLTQQAKDTGAVMSNDTVSSLDDFGDSIGQMQQSLSAMAGEILTDLTPTLQGLISEVKENGPEIKETVSGIAKGIGDVITFLVENGNTIIPIIGGIGAGMLTWNVVSMMSGVVGIIKGTTTATTILNATVAANPIMLVITLIATLVAALVTAYNTNETFRNGVNELFGDIGSALSSVGSGLKTFFTQTIPDGLDSAGKSISSWWDGLVTDVKNLPSTAEGWAKDMLDGFIAGIKKKIQAIKDAAGDIAKSIKSFLHFSRPDEGPLRDYETWMPDFMDGMAGGISDNKYKVTDAIKNLSTDMQVNLNGAASAKAGNTKLYNVTQVYLGNKQLTSELAGGVVKKITSNQVNKSAAKGVTMA